MQQVDQEAIDKAKILDIAKPPMKTVPHQEFPKMVYKHPKDKAQEHKTRIVADAAELAAALKAGWLQKPHIPAAPPEADANE